jgi:hypothetical protein
VQRRVIVAVSGHLVEDGGNAGSIARQRSSGISRIDALKSDSAPWSFRSPYFFASRALSSLRVAHRLPQYERNYSSAHTNYTRGQKVVAGIKRL